jgi:hypothetical protein
MPMLALTPSIGDERMLQVVKNFPRRQLRAIDVGRRQHHGELIAAQPRHRIRRAQRIAQARGHFLQHHVTGVVSERVVDFLETVQIDQQHREALVVTMRAQDRLLQAIEKQRAVGKIGERVVVREVGNALAGQVALPPDRGLAQFPLDGRRQPREVVLHDVVVRARPHRGDGGVFADRAGDKNEGQIRMLFADDRQRLGAAESGHGVIGDYEIPLALVQLAAQRLRVLDSTREDVVAGSVQRTLDQGRIILRVLDLQEA